MRVEAEYVTGATVFDEWGAEPNLRAEIKRKLGDEIAVKMLSRGLIDFVVTRNGAGDTVVTASTEATSTGDEIAAHRGRK